MTKQNDETIQRISVSSLPITQWHELAKSSLEISVTTTLVGDSMRPLIRRGLDRVTIIPLRRKLHKGDVVLFSRGDGVYVVHRVWKLDGNVNVK